MQIIAEGMQLFLSRDTDESGLQFRIPSALTALLVGVSVLVINEMVGRRTIRMRTCTSGGSVSGFIHMWHNPI
eukprot:12896657-Prorocentrum_lima.AAC.1